MDAGFVCVDLEFNEGVSFDENNYCNCIYGQESSYIPFRVKITARMHALRWPLLQHVLCALLPQLLWPVLFCVCTRGLALCVCVCVCVRFQNL